MYGDGVFGMIPQWWQHFLDIDSQEDMYSICKYTLEKRD